MENDEARKAKQLLRELKEGSGSSKLDWIYQKKTAEGEHEDFLLGKRIDKSFEASKSQSLESRVGFADIPQPTLRATSPAKAEVYNSIHTKEDPLFLIKQREEAARQSLLNHPVRLKQLQKLKMKSLNKESSDEDIDRKLAKKLKKLKKHSPEFIDQLLFKKLRKLKNINIKELLEEAESESGSDEQTEAKSVSKRLEKEEDYKRRRKEREHRRSTSLSPYRRRRSRSPYQKKRVSPGTASPSPPRKEKRFQSRPERAHPGRKDRHGDMESRQNKNDSVNKERDFSRRQEGGKIGLSAEERERRLKEMERDAKQRDIERMNNVAKYREDAAKDDAEAVKEKDPEFLRRELTKAASIGSVESRIKANVANIQRSKTAMEKNFARR
ncbi:pre-mRNA-splicing factor CWC25 homolog [Artemia franciscana]|uniref:pre-mRNA-splicing factor CWC25 homolog n=1 Tax=Artemia franciscana TaxID=6661 RepID=UPI0032DB1193